MARLLRLSLLLFVLVAGAHAQSPFHYILVDDQATDIAYDRVHDLLFVSLTNEDRVDVYSATGFQKVKQIYAQHPGALDLSPDCSRLYAASSGPYGYQGSEQFYEIDTATLKLLDRHVMPIPLPDPGHGQYLVVPQTIPRQVASMADGTAFVTASQFDSGGDYIFIWTPGTESFVLRNVTPSYADVIKKSADGTTVVFGQSSSVGEELWSYSTVSHSGGHLSPDGAQAYAVLAVSPDGTRILGSHGPNYVLWDANLQQVAVQPYGSVSMPISGAAYSVDGTRIYVSRHPFSYGTSVIDVLDATTLQLIGSSQAWQPYSNQTNNGLVISNSGRAFQLSSRGVYVTDVSSPIANFALQYGGFSFPFTAHPGTGSASDPATAQLNGVGFVAGASVLFGDAAATSVSVTNTNFMQVTPPPHAPGVVDLSAFFTNGTRLYAPQAYSYGPKILYLQYTAGSASGGTTMDILGYGFGTGAEFGGSPSGVQVLIGGAAATISKVGQIGWSPFDLPIQRITLTTPPGNPGAADVRVTTAFGSDTMPRAFTYLSMDVLPTSVFYGQLKVDDARHVLYATNGGTGKVDVYTADALHYVSSYAACQDFATGLTFTLDHSHLLVTCRHNMALVDLSAPSATAPARVYDVTPTGPQPNLYPNFVAAVAGNRAFVDVNDSNLYDNSQLAQVDLASGAVTWRPDFLNLIAYAQIVASPDGSVANLLGEIWKADSDTFGPYFHTDEGSDCDLDAAANVLSVGSTTGGRDMRLRTRGYYFDLVTPAFSRVYGTKLHPTGSYIYNPRQNSIEIMDVRSGQPLYRIATPLPESVTLDALALSADGQHVYSITNGALVHIVLPPLPVSIGSVVPEKISTEGGEHAVVYAHGAQSGAGLFVDDTPVDYSARPDSGLDFITPSHTQSGARLSLVNPDGSRYDLDAALLYREPNPIPQLTGVDVTSLISFSGRDITFTGSGFTPSSQIMANGKTFPVTFVSPTEITSAPLTDAAGQITFTVVNPGPGGGTSNGVTVPVLNPAPTLTLIYPTSTFHWHSLPQKIYVAGGPFVPGAVLSWNGIDLVPDQFYKTQLGVPLPANLFWQSGTVKVTVKNPGPGGGETVALTATVLPATCGKQPDGVYMYCTDLPGSQPGSSSSSKAAQPTSTAASSSRPSRARRGVPLTKTGKHARRGTSTPGQLETAPLSSSKH